MISSRFCIVSLFLFVVNAEHNAENNTENNAELEDFSRELRLKRKLSISTHDLKVAVKVAEEIISKWHRVEINLVGSGIEVQENSPSHGQLIDSYPTAEALDFGKHALVANRASLYLVHKHCQHSRMLLSDCVEQISQKALSETPLGEKCSAQFKVVNCTGPRLYRTYDGSCNHNRDPTWGKSLTAYNRLLPAVYANGIDEPRRSAFRRPLPSPRLISVVLLPDLDESEKDTTLAFVQWTQFISNDLAHTPVNKMIHTGNAIECCNTNGRNLSPRYLHPICQPINIPIEDPDYSPHRTVCMNYVRSLTSLRDKCNFGWADQMNQATHFLDGSMIYGCSATKAMSLRIMANGKLATTMKNNNELLPKSDTPEESCQSEEEDEICFKSGDPRVNLHPHHTALYTIWVREHNRIAETLAQMNNFWNDERIFEEARKIVTAEIQHITYKYWVPYVLGSESVENTELEITSGFSQGFSEDVNPAISNSFATAGLMFINSMFQGKLKLYDDQGLHNDTLFLKDHFNKPSVLEDPKVFQQLLRGLGLEESQQMDVAFVKDITNFLFRGSSPVGQDIASLDIQRGRDHGLPGYNEFRKYCGLPSNNKFHTFLDTIPLSNLYKLKLLYNHPDDVDLIVGAIMESPTEGSPLGPVFQCIIKEQMIRTRTGDAFFYDLGGKPHSFTPGQLNEIKKATLSRVICDNVKGMEKMQVDVFNVPSSENPLVSCNDVFQIPKLNLGLWKSN